MRWTSLALAVLMLAVVSTTDLTQPAASLSGTRAVHGVPIRDRDNCGTNGGAENKHDPQVQSRKALAGRRSFQAERGGFSERSFAALLESWQLMIL